MSDLSDAQMGELATKVLTAKSRLGVVLAYSKAFLCFPYVWGGSHPAQGFDCSGLVQEFLSAVGLDPPGDQNAQTLYNEMKETATKIEIPQPGSILFFGGNKSTITHVAFAIDELHMIEAGGGGSKTLTIKDAIAHKAFVRVRPIANRKDLVACLLPKY